MPRRNTLQMETISKRTDVNVENVKKVYDTIFDLIKENLENGENTIVVGFGTFRIGNRKARKGIKPKTGEVIEIAPRRVITFKPSPVFKKLVNEKRRNKNEIQ